MYKPIRYNKSSRNNTPIKYIVIHDTGNRSKGADALAHYRYFNGGNRGASAHYFIDDKRVVQLVGDSLASWHCGDGKGRYGITNSNSIGIEICINSDGDYNIAVANTIELVKNLMERFNVPAERVIRHYDTSRKSCPNTMKPNNWAKWKWFHDEIKKPKKLIMDLSKDSLSKEVHPTQSQEKNDMAGGSEKGSDNKDVKAFEKNGLKIIQLPIERAYTQQLGGRTLREVGVYGINGVFFDPSTAPPSSSRSTCAIAINGGKPIGENSHINYYKDPNVKRATILWGEGRLTVEYLNNIKEANRKIDFAIGGIGMIPVYDPTYEKVEETILREKSPCPRTAVAFKGKTLYYIVTDRKVTVGQFRDMIARTLDVDGAINIDGGGSTQMLYKNNFGIHTSRKLNSVIGIK